MDIGFEQKVRERAYELWMASGMADGMSLDHWCAAEKDLHHAAPKPALAKATASKAPPAKKATSAKTPRTKAAGAKAAAKKPGVAATAIN